MAGSWRGYRPLALDGRRFRWRCAFWNPWTAMSAGAEELAAQLDRLLVRPEDAADRLLSVHWPFRESPVVKPALVRACVEEALRRGWPDRLAVLEMAGAEVPSPGEG